MDVLAQASNIVEQVEAGRGRVTLALDLDDPAQRAAYAAALAVLLVHGLDPLASAELSGAAPGGEDQARNGVLDPASEPAAAGRSDLRGPTETPPDAGANDAADAPIRRSYVEAVGDLTTDEARAQQIVRETFPRVRELLRDGANVEAVAQIQYRRWTEEHLDSARN